jgi:hypothetical protein
LADPLAAWPQPALTTFKYQNHAVRSEGWRYIRYANGDEELYDEKADGYEWRNLASDPRYAAIKTELAKHLPAAGAQAVGKANKRPAERKRSPAKSSSTQ